ncbi:MAG TPA: hypothetical protein DDW90_03345 [Cyanobacteria bacterium UBA9971]|nr:hypothetical protein [Cyanobacteria bacterium UBA9971]
MQREYKEQRQHIIKKLGLLIKQARIEKTKSISLISDEVGLSKSIWADLERGQKDPQFTTLWRIAEALEIPLSQIIASLEEEIDKNLSFIEK